MKGREAVYGSPPIELGAPADAMQLSPLIPGADAMEEMPNASLSRVVVVAPPGTLERRFVLAHALRALTPGGELIALAPKDRGGARLRKELEAFGCAVQETARRHHRICLCHRPAEPIGLDAAIAGGALQFVPSLGLWSQPGVFAWDRIDPGSARLVEPPPTLAGRGADLGCGWGVLARAVLASPAVTALALVDLDRRAIDAARRNIDDPRASFLQHDLRRPPPNLVDLDFVIMNPPFHEGGRDDKALGQAFVAAAAAMLKKGGMCRLVANAALPYEAALARDFSRVALLDRSRGYKVYEAHR